MSHSATNLSAVDDLSPRLSAQDRCDSCGAQAYIRATLPTGDLLFCAHHGAKFKEKLSQTALAWHDETDRLFEPESHA